jgi:hypothetical protein
VRDNLHSIDPARHPQIGDKNVVLIDGSNQPNSFIAISRLIHFDLCTAKVERSISAG